LCYDALKDQEFVLEVCIGTLGALEEKPEIPRFSTGLICSHPQATEQKVERINNKRNYVSSRASIYVDTTWLTQGRRGYFLNRQS